MRVDVAHLILEALGDADDQVVDDGPYCPQGGDTLAGAVVDFDRDYILLGQGEVDADVAQVLGKLASGALDCDLSCLDGDLDCVP